MNAILDTEMIVTPIEPGEYEVRCAELCGLRHSDMLSMVVVEDIAGWAKFVEEHGTPIVVDTSDPIAYGRSLFQQYGCVGCHTLTDANSNAIVGPELNGIGSRRGEDYIRESIMDPRAVIVEGFIDTMPKNFSEMISPEEIDALVKYLLLQE